MVSDTVLPPAVTLPARYVIRFAKFFVLLCQGTKSAEFIVEGKFGYRPLPAAYRLLPTAYCLLPTAYCLLPRAQAARLCRNTSAR